MKILLVRPENSTETIGLQHLMIVEPLELEILAAKKRPTDEVLLIDMILEKKPLTHFIKVFEPDLLGVTGYITNVNTIISYCTIAKSILPGITTIVGGVHCEVCSEDFDHPSIDYRVVRNAAVTFPFLLNHIDKNDVLPHGILKKGEIIQEAKLPPFDFSVPIPDRQISNKYRHQYFYIFQDKIALIKTSFGCPYTCSFCFCREITSGIYHPRPIEEVLKELSTITEQEIYIVDDDFLVGKSRLEEFISGVKEKDIHKNYLIYGRADFIARNPEIMRQFKEIGLRTVIVGFESFSENELEMFHKNISVQTNREAMTILNQLDIGCFATMIVSPDWDADDFDRMIGELKSLGIHFVNLQPLTPLPGTGFSIREDNLLIDRKEYEKWDLAHLSIKPTKMSSADFYKQIVRAYEEILFQPGIVWKYLLHQSWKMLFNMIAGSYRVHRQYKSKIKEAEQYA